MLLHSLSGQLNNRSKARPHRVQRALGHRQITTTGVYAKVSDHRLKVAVGRR